jgi:hypothetical protein
MNSWVIFKEFEKIIVCEVLAVKFIAFYEQFKLLEPFFANVVEALVY